MARHKRATILGVPRALNQRTVFLYTKCIYCTVIHHWTICLMVAIYIFLLLLAKEQSFRHISSAKNSKLFTSPYRVIASPISGNCSIYLPGIFGWPVNSNGVQNIAVCYRDKCMPAFVQGDAIGFSKIVTHYLAPQLSGDRNGLKDSRLAIQKTTQAIPLAKNNTNLQQHTFGEIIVPRLQLPARLLLHDECDCHDHWLLVARLCNMQQRVR